MSLQAMAWAREAMPTLPVAIKAGPRLLLMLMADYANEQGVCWPSIRRLSAEMACSMRTVQRSIEALVEQELMEVVPRQTKTGRQTSNFYRLAMGVTQQQQAADEPSPEELEALMAGSDEEEVSARPAAAIAEHPIFANVAQQTDSGEPQAIATARQISMTLDWRPDATHWQAEALRRGDPSLTWDQGELADFTAHFADQPGRTYSLHAWCAKFVRWVSDNRKREASRQARMSQNTNTSSNNNTRNAGGIYGSHCSTGPIRNSRLSAAEGRALIEKRRREQAEGQPPSGDLIDGEWL
ncbi:MULTISPECIES: DnaT-like ssDNA-binding domain-containing protein [Cobetia]|uniref:DnaT-like ssDNA-binding domain-containing protein n=1 Tax=Cobetia TaxID=204286 RepID=UPI0009852BFC|nr:MULTISPECIES: DnaT-like ssDNA-binding domain-containing protein [Cobetia]POR07216.1 hypothetical protein BOH68_06365 [Cobetia sp. MM1IDA2H-1]